MLGIIIVNLKGLTGVNVGYRAGKLTNRLLNEFEITIEIEDSNEVS